MQKTKIKWSNRAEEDANIISDYIEVDNEKAAKRTLDNILLHIKILETFPNIGRKGERFNTRELIILNTPYIIVYRVQKNTVNILRVLHSKRKYV